MAQGAVGYAHGAIVQRADQRVGLDRQRRLRKLLWEAPDLPAAGNRRMVVEEHLVCEAADFAIETDRDDLAALSVVAEAGRVRTADELVVPKGAGYLQRTRPHTAQRQGDGGGG